VKLFLWNGGNFVNFECNLYNKWNQVYCYCVSFIVKIYVEPSYDFKFYFIACFSTLTDLILDFWRLVFGIVVFGIYFVHACS